VCERERAPKRESEKRREREREGEREKDREREREREKGPGVCVCMYVRVWVCVRLCVCLSLCKRERGKLQRLKEIDKVRRRERELCRLFVLAFITGNSRLGPLLEGVFAQIHIELS